MCRAPLRLEMPGARKKRDDDVKKLLAIATALVGMSLSTSAMAQSAASGTVNITATVTATCKLNTATGAVGLLDTARLLERR